MLVQSDLKGQGLGWRLMQHLIDYAKAEGMEELFGSVLGENTTMLQMCRELGFSIAVEPGDLSLRQVRLVLSPASSLIPLKGRTAVVAAQLRPYQPTAAPGVRPPP